MKGKFLTLVGTALTLALTSNVAVAQSTNKFLISQQSQPSSQSEKTAPEIKLSPEAKKILCEYFPLNSRCESKAGATQQSPSTQTKPAGGSVNPGASTTDPSAPGSNVSPTQTPNSGSGSGMGSGSGTTP